MAGGLVGANIGGGAIQASYATGQTTAALQRSTGYTGIYATWNLDLNGDGCADNPLALRYHVGVPDAAGALRVRAVNPVNRSRRR